MNKDSFFSTLPSLVINVTDSCNFNCSYCPPYGENMCKGYIEYDNSAVLEVIELAKEYHLPLTRITGGEPFLEPDRVRMILDACGNYFKRLVVNTNGSLIGKHFDWLELYKSNFVLKVSLDSLSPEGFQNMSGTDSLSVVYNNLLEALNRKFNIEINCVVFNQPFEELCSIVNFATANGITCKFLTIKTFHGAVNYQSNRDSLSRLIEHLQNLAIVVKEEQLDVVRGGAMKVYPIGKSKVILFDHSVENSITPKKTYFSLCENECSQYPCDDGALSIFISTDGILCPCRGRKDLGANIFFHEKAEISSTFLHQLEYFKECFTINVNNRRSI